MDWLVQDIEDLHGQGGRLLWLAILVEQAELVAAQMGEGDAPSHHPGGQVLTDGLEQLVAQPVAEALVDVLEVIEVEQQDCALAFLQPDSLQGMLDTLLEKQAVRQAGEWRGCSAIADTPRRSCDGSRSRRSSRSVGSAPATSSGRTFRRAGRT